MRSLLLWGKPPGHKVQCQARGFHTRRATPSLSTRRRPATRRETGRRRAKVAQRLLILLLHKGQLAQMVDVAQRMAAGGVGAICRPAVVDTHAPELRQDANGRGRLAAPLA